MIELKGICKDYRVAKRAAGIGQAVKSLFARRYETIHALRDMTFIIPDGQIVGYIGPNGAGKSTTIKIMCGILTPDSGSCIVNGWVPWKDRREYVGHIGVVFGQRSQIWWDVPVIDSLELIRDIYGVDTRKFNQMLEELAELLALEDLLKTPARMLSLGQRMRCELAASLLHRPQVLFLDEPTIGLDAVSKLAVRQFIGQLRQEYGTTVILTTHDMQDIEALADRVLLIGKGRLLFDGSLEQMHRAVDQTKRVVITYTGTLAQVPRGAAVQERQAGRITLEVDPNVLPVPALLSAFSTQVSIQDITVSGRTAEELVAALYKGFAL